MATIKLKMVAGKTFVCLPVFGDKVVTKGEVVEVDAKHKDYILQASYLDALDNKHFYFKETDEGTGLPGFEAPKKVTRESKRAKPAAAPVVEDADEADDTDTAE